MTPPPRTRREDPVLTPHLNTATLSTPTSTRPHRCRQVDPTSTPMATTSPWPHQVPHLDQAVSTPPCRPPCRRHHADPPRRRHHVDHPHVDAPPPRRCPHVNTQHYHGPPHVDQGGLAGPYHLPPFPYLHSLNCLR